MILIIDVCKHDLHRMEFVKPIEDIISLSQIPYMTVRYKDLRKSHIAESHRIIIAGTSLADNDYSKHIKRFRFLASYRKPVLGICAGMQILCMVHGCRLIKSREIGLKDISFNAKFLGIQGKREVYALHNYCITDDDALKRHFKIYASSKDCVHAVKHRDLQHFGVLFHPEVRNKDIVTNFLSE